LRMLSAAPSSAALSHLPPWRTSLLAAACLALVAWATYSYFSALAPGGQVLYAGTLHSLTYQASSNVLPPNSFCVLGIFKNERSMLREWTEHYLWQGAAEIVLLDNGSTDDWRGSLRGIPHVSVFSAPSAHSQIPYYNSLGAPYLRKRGCSIVLVADLDEFWVSTDRVLLSAFQRVFANDSVSQMRCPWIMFGSSGLAQQPASTRRAFVWRKSEPDFGNTKAVVRLSAATELRVHWHYVSHGETIGCAPGFQVNHYPIQSREWFAATKMTRGDVNARWADSIRDWDYFKRYDWHEEADFVLANWTADQEALRR